MIEIIPMHAGAMIVGVLEKQKLELFPERCIRMWYYHKVTFRHSLKAKKCLGWYFSLSFRSNALNINQLPIFQVHLNSGRGQLIIMKGEFPRKDSLENQLEIPGYPSGVWKLTLKSFIDFDGKEPSFPLKSIIRASREFMIDLYLRTTLAALKSR